MNRKEQQWAQEEFGTASLEDQRRTRRVVKIAAMVAQKPAGKVTEVFFNSADREGTFRFLEKEEHSPEVLKKSAAHAALLRCQGIPWVYVPVDGTSLAVTDRGRSKGFGLVGTRKQKATGVQVLSALCVHPSGRPEGLVGQTYFLRSFRKPRRIGKNQPLEKKETRHWVDLLKEVKQTFQEEAKDLKPWFQLDRGGDALPILVEGIQEGALLTVRSSWNRCLVKDEASEKRKYLWDTLKQEPCWGSSLLDLEEGPSRKGRVATMEVRVRRVQLYLQERMTHQETTLWVQAVYTREVGTTPAGESPLEWMLLTNAKVDTLKAAEAVIEGYRQRWRIEEFHKMWKSGACKVEDSQLRSVNSFVLWAVILASVAVRILRLSYLSRTEPDLPATWELRACEVEAVVRLFFQGKQAPKGIPTIRQVALWIARLGGYAGNPNKAPPGPLVLARGLAYIEPVVRLLEAGDRM